MALQHYVEVVLSLEVIQNFDHSFICALLKHHNFVPLLFNVKLLHAYFANHLYVYIHLGLLVDCLEDECHVFVILKSQLFKTFCILLLINDLTRSYTFEGFIFKILINCL